LSSYLHALTGTDPLPNRHTSPVKTRDEFASSPAHIRGDTSLRRFAGSCAHPRCQVVATAVFYTALCDIQTILCHHNLHASNLHTLVPRCGTYAALPSPMPRLMRPMSKQRLRSRGHALPNATGLMPATSRDPPWVCLSAHSSYSQPPTQPLCCEPRQAGSAVPHHRAPPPALPVAQQRRRASS
jgi:hypothetical protein